MHPANTERLILREATEGDASFMLQLLTEPSWRRFIRDHDVDSVDKAREYLQERIIDYYGKGLGFWLVEIKETAEPIGICGLIKRDYLEHVDIGFAYLEAHWGKGFASEACATTLNYAFEALQLPTVCAITLPSNAQSIRTLQALDFQLVAEQVDDNKETILLYEKHAERAEKGAY